MKSLRVTVSDQGLQSFYSAALIVLGNTNSKMELLYQYDCCWPSPK